MPLAGRMAPHGPHECQKSVPVAGHRDKYIRVVLRLAMLRHLVPRVPGCQYQPLPPSVPHPRRPHAHLLPSGIRDTRVYTAMMRPLVSHLMNPACLSPGKAAMIVLFTLVKCTHPSPPDVAFRCGQMQMNNHET